jgi:hypothetical protein
LVILYLTLVCVLGPRIRIAFILGRREYKFLINFLSIPIIKFHIKNLHTIIISN